MNWNKLEGIINKVAIKNRISPSVVKSIINHVFVQVKKTLRNPMAPKVLLHEYGTFKPCSKKIKQALQRLINKKDEMDPDVYEEIFERYTQLLKRLEDEDKN